MRKWKNFDFLLRNFRLSKKRVFTVLCLLVFLIVFLSSNFEPMTRNDFEWLRNKNDLKMFIGSDQLSAVLEPQDMSALNERQLIACFVMSAPKNHFARTAIRMTWGRAIKPIFLIAIGDSETTSAVEKEAQMFDDIIVEDFIDSYFNLTIKTAFAMKNFLRHFENSKYFMKIDDDVFLNVDNLKKMIEQAPSDALIGRVAFNLKPIRDEYNKWFVPSFLYPEDEYPPFLRGSAYLIPG